MSGITVDRKVTFILEVGKTVMDEDGAVARDIEAGLKEYGFKDARILGAAKLEETKPGVEEDELPR